MDCGIRGTIAPYPANFTLRQSLASLTRIFLTTHETNIGDLNSWRNICDIQDCVPFSTNVEILCSKATRQEKTHDISNEDANIAKQNKGQRLLEIKSRTLQTRLIVAGRLRPGVAISNKDFGESATNTWKRVHHRKPIEDYRHPFRGCLVALCFLGLRCPLRSFSGVSHLHSLRKVSAPLYSNALALRIVHHRALANTYLHCHSLLVLTCQVHSFHPILTVSAPTIASPPCKKCLTLRQGVESKYYVLPQ